MTGDAIPISEAAEIRWREYVAAAEKAQRTLVLEDGLAARRAWSRFILAYDRLPSQPPRGPP